jgi:hypothetical protein
MASFALYFNGLSPEAQLIALNSSALPPPAGIVPDFANPPNSDSLAHGVLATVLIVTVTSVVLALYGKTVVLKNVHFEDGMIPNFDVLSWECLVLMLANRLRPDRDRKCQYATSVRSNA